VVPLDVVDPVLVEDRQHLALNVLVRSRARRGSERAVRADSTAARLVRP
jgi:hypothetical protein